MVEAIGKALSAVTSGDARGFFDHCGYPMAQTDSLIRLLMAVKLLAGKTLSGRREHSLRKATSSPFVKPGETSFVCPTGDDLLVGGLQRGDDRDLTGV